MTRPDRAELARRTRGMVGELPFAPPPPSSSFTDGVLPRPRSVVPGPPVPVGAVHVSGPAGPVRILREGLWRTGIALAGESDAGGRPYPVEVRIDPHRAPAAPEGYRLEATAEGIDVAAADLTGATWGAATARQLFRGGQVHTGTIVDEPVVPLRLLAGWGLYRDHHLDWALEVAVAGKFNRVLYNWWGATPAEHMGDRERTLIDSARSVGIELVCELRRQALGPDFDVDAVLDHYGDAVDHGFTTFGFCFDDTDFDSFDAEFGLLDRIVTTLTTRLGHEPEFFFCPRFYWYPGQMDYSWLAPLLGGDAMGGMLGATDVRTVDEARARQEDYLRRLGEVLPERTVLYLANMWSGTAGDWAGELERGWTALVGRPPVFWDNQQQNDYRAGAIYPVALHQRPPGFGHAIAGYCLNSGRPLSAFAAASVTSGAWAWNPDGYDAEVAHGEAIQQLYGAAAPAMVEAMGRLEQFRAPLLAPRIGSEQHYAGMARALAAGRRAELEDQLDALAAALAAARWSLSPRAHPLCHHALDAFDEEVDRLRLDLDVASGDERALAAVTEMLAGRLPPTPPGQSVSWRLHFLDGPLRHAASICRRAHNPSKPRE